MIYRKIVGDVTVEYEGTVEEIKKVLIDERKEQDIDKCYKPIKVTNGITIQGQPDMMEQFKEAMNIKSKRIFKTEE